MIKLASQQLYSGNKFLLMNMLGSLPSRTLISAKRFYLMLRQWINGTEMRIRLANKFDKMSIVWHISDKNMLYLSDSNFFDNLNMPVLCEHLKVLRMTRVLN